MTLQPPTSEETARLRVRIDATGGALLKLAAVAPGLPEVLADLLAVVAEEATRTPRFAKSIDAALRGADRPTVVPPRKAATPARRTKRAPGAFDPFTVYRAGGDDGLRGKLASLSVDELKDIIAEHGMDYDKLAMRWKTATRLQDRIVERVIARESKGDAFR